jgi:hypothetical protein
MTTIPSAIQSLLICRDVANAPVEGTPRQVVASSVTASVPAGFHDLVIAALNGKGTEPVLAILEALDGDCKGQKVLALAFNEATDTLRTTPFRTAAPTTRTFLYRHWSWPKATATGAGSETTTVSSYRTETDDFWNGFQMLALFGSNADLEAITDFVAGTDTFTHGAMAVASAAGDACLIVQALKVAGAKITADPGKAIEREVVTDTGEPEGIVPGAAENLGLTLTPEIRGLDVAAADGVTASPPGELKAALATAFEQVLGTGDTAEVGGSVTTPTVHTGSRFAAGSIAMVNGDAFGVVAVNTGATPDELTVPAGHIRTAPAENDVIYAGASYKPKTSGHGACSFLAWLGRSELIAMTGGMAAWKAKIDRNALAHYELEWSFIDCLRATFPQPHYDRYNAATPLVGRGNVSRIVFDGAELPGEVLSAELELLPAPANPTAAFGAVENKTARRYLNVLASAKIVLWMEDSRYWHRYRAMAEADMLLQVGRVPTAAWALWGARTQIVAIEDGDADGLRTVTVTFRFLRPSTQGLPSFVMAHL